MSERPIAVVLDDSQPFLMYLSLLLHRMNFEVLPVTNATEALDVSRVTQPKVIIMDFVMPEIDGLEALRQIREDKDLKGLAVIMVSGYQKKSLQWEALSLGCVDVLEKPIDLRRLHKAVQSCDPFSTGRRRYLRTVFEENVTLHYDGEKHTVTAVTLSERGMFFHTRNELPQKAQVDIDIPLPSGEFMTVGGSIIYAKKSTGQGDVASPGLAVKFDRLTMETKETLSRLVEDMLISDIVAEQTEPVVKPG